MNAAFATHYILRKVDNDHIWSALLQGGTTHYAGAPTVQIGIVNHARAKRLPRTIRVAVAASAPTSALLSRMEELNLLPVHVSASRRLLRASDSIRQQEAKLAQVYGLTESYGPVSRREFVGCGNPKNASATLSRPFFPAPRVSTQILGRAANR